MVQCPTIEHGRSIAKNVLQELYAKSLDFGVMLDRTTMLALCTTQPTFDTKITFHQDMLRREILVEFPLEIRDPRPTESSLEDKSRGKYNRTDRLKFRMPFPRIGRINRVEARGKEMILLVSLDNPPNYYKQIDPDHSHDNGRFWKDNDAWYRQTDVVYAPSYLKNKPLALQKAKPILELGEILS